MKYRPEIDGLRAVAVMPVLLFHAGFSLFSGGYVGVDIFFVISGYLITTIILADLEKDRFSILTFYERRARRILPALFLVMLCAVPFAYMWAPPLEFRDFAQSLVAVSLFASNILFWRESGYFETEAEEKPLLHTWSLAVEEQYYVFFPLLLLVMWRFGRQPSFYVVLGLTAVSLALSEWASHHYRSANFYLAPFRVWELLAGSICAFMLSQREPRATDMRTNLAATLGLIGICVAILLYDSKTRFPSVYTLLPVMGTVLIILYATPATLAGRVLTWRPMIWIGLISYSAYLWHQPLFAFARIRIPGHPPDWVMGALLLASLGLAYLTWRYVEAPFRHHGAQRSRFGRGQIFALSAAGLLGFIALGAAGHMTPLQRFSDQQQAYFDTALPNPNRQSCHASNRRPILPEDACIYGDGPASVAVFGDSHAAELSLGLSRALAPEDIAVRHFSYSSCGPVPPPDAIEKGCDTWSDAAQDWIIANDEITHVVVSYRINAHLTGRHEESYPDLPDTISDSYRARTIAALQETLVRMSAHKKTIFVLQAPELPEPIARIIARRGDTDGPLTGVSRDWWTARNQIIKGVLAATDAPGLVIVDPATLMCDPDQCYAGLAGRSYYFDDDHMSILGARRLSQEEILPHILGPSG